MPFVAMYKDDQGKMKRVDITRFRNPKSELYGKEIVCQACGAPMIVKAGMLVRPHFAHKADYNRDCAYNNGGGGESYEHLIAKQALVDLLSKRDDYTRAKIYYEVWIPEARRIADVYVVHEDGYCEAHEAQLASIDLSTLDERTRDYTGAGVDVIWWLGKSADTSENRQWCLQNIGGYGVLTFDYTERRIV